MLGPTSSPESGSSVCGRFAFGFVVRPLFGERVSGDAAMVADWPDHLLVALIDVLGHGGRAAAVADKIRSFLLASSPMSLQELYRNLRDATQRDRGAAIILCVIAKATGVGQFVGIGNTVCRVVGSSDVRLMPMAGILGQTHREPVCRPMGLQIGDTLIMHSDGVSSRFKLTDYPGLRHAEPRTVAMNIVHRFGKSHDDSSCLVVRRQEVPSAMGEKR